MTLDGRLDMRVVTDPLPPRFWLALAGSLTGRWIHAFAQAWLVHALTGSPLWLGVVAALGALPSLLLARWAGARVDAGCKRRLLIVTQTASMLLAALMAALAATTPGAGAIAVVALAFGLVAAVDTPALHAWMLERAGVGRGPGSAGALARHTLLFNLTRMAAPLAAAVLIAGGSAAACFLLNALSFVPMLAVLWRAPAIPVHAARDPAAAHAHQGAVPRRQLLRLAVFSALALPAVALLPALATESLALDVRGLGGLTAAVGLGACAAALAGWLRPTWIARRDWITAVGCITGAALALLALVPALAWPAALAAGAGISAFIALVSHAIHAAVPPHRRGRASAWHSAGLVGSAPVGHLALGLAAEHWGSGASIAAAAALLVLLLLALQRSALPARAGEVSDRDAPAAANDDVATLRALPPSHGAASSAQSAGVGATRPSNSRSLTRMLRPALRTSACACQRDSTRLTVTRVV